MCCYQVGPMVRFSDYFGLKDVLSFLSSKGKNALKHSL